MIKRGKETIKTFSDKQMNWVEVKEDFDKIKDRIPEGCINKIEKEIKKHIK